VAAAADRETLREPPAMQRADTRLLRHVHDVMAGLMF
jgi:hypothetical protein